MSAVYAILISLGACVVAAVLEGVCAGKNVKSFFSTLRFPPFSAPLWVWSIIGVLYYAIFCFLLYRLLRLDADSAFKHAALTLILFMMTINALTNYIIFRARNLRLSFIVGALFPILDIALFICLIQLDKVAAWSLTPYLLYRIYAVWWGYGLWKLNSGKPTLPNSTK
jgi:tryptophan-rich sensory protein